MLRRTLLAGTLALTVTGITLIAIPGASTILGLMSISVAATWAVAYALMCNRRMCVSIFDADV